MKLNKKTEGVPSHGLETLGTAPRLALASETPRQLAKAAGERQLHSRDRQA